MLDCYTNLKTPSIPVHLVCTTDLESWLEKQSESLRAWVRRVNFRANKGQVCIVPALNGDGIFAVLFGINDKQNPLQVGSLATQLPEGQYHLVSDWDAQNLAIAATAWGMNSYRFTRYKKSDPYPAKLKIPEECDADEISRNVQTIHWVRDLINTPPQDMNTNHLAAAAHEMAESCGAQFDQTEGIDLVTANYPLIYAVGKGSEFEPHLLDIRWGNEKHPKVTLVGKGVCFDSGGLDIKSAAGMITMKKDMAGAAHVLGLAKMIMQAKLPIRLRVLVPAVENAVSGRAYHPSDILDSRKGLTVEVTNTDAEGRLILADALAEAASENPDLIIDIATLTGAARVALGTELGALFSNDESLATEVLAHSQKVQDPLWRLPLYTPYRSAIDSKVADLSNAVTSTPYGGAITAALFLKEFVGETIPWLHFDIMAWNPSASCTGPEGAEINAIRTLYDYLKTRFTQK